jgi:hypothetical protein
MFLGSTFFAGDLTATTEPSNINNCTDVLFENCLLSEIFITKNTSPSITPTWTFDTILKTDFPNNTLNAGNVSFTVQNTENLVIKRREKGQFDWIPVFVKEIETEDDFDIIFSDYTNRAGITYEYALVPVSSGIEGSYNITEVNSSFEGMFLVKKDAIMGTEYNVGSVDTTRNIDSITVKKLNSQFPTHFKLGKSNYDSGSFSGVFIDTTNYKINEVESTDLRKDVLDYISAGDPMVLKLDDGRIWLIAVKGNIMNSGNGPLKAISAEWDEIGDVNSAKSRFRAGISDVGGEWW